jgi:hypothetical protein
VPASECVISPYRVNGGGVPYIRRVPLHMPHSRWVWIEKNGPIPEGMQINHHCDNARCINLDHLYLGTQRENVRDAFERGRRDMKACHAGQWWRDA